MYSKTSDNGEICQPYGSFICHIVLFENLFKENEIFDSWTCMCIIPEFRVVDATCKLHVWSTGCKHLSLMFKVIDIVLTEWKLVSQTVSICNQGECPWTDLRKWNRIKYLIFIDCNGTIIHNQWLYFDYRHLLHQESNFDSRVYKYTYQEVKGT